MVIKKLDERWVKIITKSEKKRGIDGYITIRAIIFLSRKLSLMLLLCTGGVEAVRFFDTEIKEYENTMVKNNY